MSDFYYVNILNEGMIPWIKKEGPLFYYHIAVGPLRILKSDPRIKISLTDYDTAMKLKEEYLAKKEANKKQLKEEISTEIKPIDKNESLNILSIKENICDSEDLEIDSILENTEITMFEANIADAPNQEIDADGLVIYSEEELMKMTKRQLKEILESRGHFGFTGKHFEKGDPLGAMYHDTIEVLREKVRKTQQTF